MGHDVVIVGAGSAGCVVANRLSADRSVRVLLVEAGEPDRKTEIGVPVAFSKLFKTELDWAYSTQPQPELAGRRLFWPRGKVLGGCSSINAMIYIRGHRADYDGWAAAGNSGWSYEEVLPVFRRSEDLATEVEVDEGFHGRGGPLRVEDLRSPNPMSSAFVAAAIESGHRRNDDFNGAEQAGVGFYHVTQKRGKRWSAASAFLRPALGRPNLEVWTGALATRVLLDGSRAVGVEVVRDGALHRVEADRVVVCGGAVNSPHLLLLSGIGSVAGLERAGVAVAHELPGVGENLHDHLIVIMGWESTEAVSLARAESLGALAKFLLRRRGPLTSNVGEAGGFVRVAAGANEAPDLQFHFAPAHFRNHGFDNPPGHGLSVGPTLVRPRSRGRLWLASSDPWRPPLLDPGYLTSAEDLDLLVAGVERALEIVGQEPLARYRRPGGDWAPALDVDSIRDFVRQGSETLYHPVGTCRMGDDEMAVVDASLAVRGIEGLWVADASIMPTIVNGNTNAPTILIGEKAAEYLTA